MRNQIVRDLEHYLGKLDELWGGDIAFNNPISRSRVEEVEIKLDFKFPSIFQWFYTQGSNGIFIDNKAILPIYDPSNKKTFVENVERFNDPSKNLYFKERSHIFNDYIIVGKDHSSLICLSKKYDFDDPLLYVCHNPNSPEGVDFDCTDMNLLTFIKKIVKDVFDSEEDDWILADGGRLRVAN